MAKADYRLCDICDGKAIYDGDDMIRDDEDVVPLFIAHRECMKEA